MCGKEMNYINNFMKDHEHEYVSRGLWMYLLMEPEQALLATPVWRSWNQNEFVYYGWIWLDVLRASKEARFEFS